MSILSPAAQAVDRAIAASIQLHGEMIHAQHMAAAAIRALVVECAYTARYHPENSELNEMVIDEADALAIAAELEEQP